MSRIQFTVPVVVEPLEGEITKTQLAHLTWELKAMADRLERTWDAKTARELASKALALALHFEKTAEKRENENAGI